MKRVVRADDTVSRPASMKLTTMSRRYYNRGHEPGQEVVAVRHTPCPALLDHRRSELVDVLNSLSDPMLSSRFIFHTIGDTAAPRMAQSRVEGVGKLGHVRACHGRGSPGRARKRPCRSCRRNTSCRSITVPFVCRLGQHRQEPGRNLFGNDVERVGAHVDSRLAILRWGRHASPSTLKMPPPIEEISQKLGEFLAFREVAEVGLEHVLDVGRVRRDRADSRSRCAYQSPRLVNSFAHDPVRLVMLKGSSGFYCYAIFEHDSHWPALNITEVRITVKLNTDKFNYMAVSDDIQRYMPCAADRDAPHGLPLAYKEVVLLVNPKEPQFKGKVDDKYGYSLDNKDNVVHGWISSTHPNPMGFWVITPNNEFKNSGPLKRELTSHIFLGTHYIGNEIVLNLVDGEYWKKAQSEVRKWPYSFPESKDFAKASDSERGSITGRILVRDRFKNNSRNGITAGTAYVGLAAPGKPSSWTTESKSYQFWTRAMSCGTFTIDHVRAGAYSLYAWVPGFLGDYMYTSWVTVKPGERERDERRGGVLASLGFGEANAIARHGIHGVQWNLEFPTKGYLLNQGGNNINITQTRAFSIFAGVLYDYKGQGIDILELQERIIEVLDLTDQLHVDDPGWQTPVSSLGSAPTSDVDTARPAAATGAGSLPSTPRHDSVPTSVPESPVHPTASSPAQHAAKSSSLQPAGSPSRSTTGPLGEVAAPVSSDAQPLSVVPQPTATPDAPAHRYGTPLSNHISQPKVRTDGT
ncbi:hypothetical protein PR202_gb10282 [Eleusine coracana subsp. coracana]|uniref:Rhamnogalacturonan endolyase n=1 Tax=Eleusine coracana subsp. coracana TaxID=191504 RepID=A0AAV5EK37_ELECO|nr:hypothetical protein PR202_gb10282 [Eleusine coracana subsp. coracana]